MKEYNKLVRDKIPEIINNDNRVAVTRILDNEEYLKELNTILQVDVKVFLVDYNVEELADIIEVIYGILDSKNVSIEEFEKVRLEKVNKRGAFKQRIFLEKELSLEEAKKEKN